MNITPFPTLSPATIDAINVIGQWLAQDDFSGEVPYQADCVILAGNAVMPTIDAACKIARDQQIPLLISGGIGHSTTFLYSAIAQHPHYNTIRTIGRAEATILADIAHQFWHIPHEKIWIEDQSTNCGENARFSIALLNQAVERVHTAIVVQDPTMQRRTMATFRRITGDNPDAARWRSYRLPLPLYRRGRNPSPVRSQSGRRRRSARASRRAAGSAPRHIRAGY